MANQQTHSQLPLLPWRQVILFSPIGHILQRHIVSEQEVNTHTHNDLSCMSLCLENIYFIPIEIKYLVSVHWLWIHFVCKEIDAIEWS